MCEHGRYAMLARGSHGSPRQRALAAGALLVPARVKPVCEPESQSEGFIFLKTV